MPRVALEYTVTLWACTARRAFAVFRGLLALLPQVGLVQCQVAQCLVADSSKERVLVAQEPQVAVTWRLRRMT